MITNHGDLADSGPANHIRCIVDADSKSYLIEMSSQKPT